MLSYLKKRVPKRFKKLYQKIKENYDIGKTRSGFPAINPINNPIVIVVVPGSLAQAYLNISILPKNQQVILLANGLDEFEIDWARRHLPQVNLVIHRPNTISHGKVIDLCINKIPASFGILDADCFLFDSNLLEEMIEVPDHAIWNACFARRTDNKWKRTSETFFLFFNRNLVLKIMNKYSVSTDYIKYNELPMRLRIKLEKIGIDAKHPLETDKPGYLDTTRILMVLAKEEGYSVNFIREFTTKKSEGIFHIGAGHNHSNLDFYWNRRGAYFWRRVIETCPFDDLKDHYNKKYGLITSNDIKRAYPDLEREMGETYFLNIENIVSQWQKL